MLIRSLCPSVCLSLSARLSRPVVCPALTGTGFIWAYYSLLVRPKSWGLFSVSVALIFANGWNALRRYNYDQSSEAIKATPIVLGQQPLIPAAKFAEKK